MNPSYMNNPSVHTFLKTNWNFFMTIILDLLNNIPNTQEINEINTVTKPDEKEKVQCSSTNHIYQNIQQEQPREKFWTTPFLLESPKKSISTTRP